MNDATIAAIQRGDCEAVTQWIRGGGDVDDVDQGTLSTALHWACDAGQLRVAELLLKNEAAVNFLNRNEESPLHWACRSQKGSDHAAIVTLLLANESNPEAKNRDGCTPQDLARGAGNVGALSVLQPAAPTPPGRPTPSPTDSSRKGEPSQDPASRPTPRPPTGERSRTPSSATAPSPRSGPLSSADKVRLELENRNQQQIIADMKKTISSLQREKIQLDAQARTAQQFKERAEVLQREKVQLEVALRQLKLDDDRSKELVRKECRAERQEGDERHESELRNLQEQLKQADILRSTLETQYNRQKEQHANALKAQMDINTEQREKLSSLQSLTIKQEYELGALRGAAEEIAELQKKNSMMAVELEGMKELRAMIDVLQEKTAELNSQVRGLNEELDRERASSAALRLHKEDFDRQAKEMEEYRAREAEFKAGEKKHAVEVNSLQEEIRQLKIANGTQEGGSGDIMDGLQKELEALQKQHLSLQKEQIEKDEEARKCSAKLASAQAESAALQKQAGEVTSVQDRLAHLATENDRLTQELGSTTAQLEALKSEREEIVLQQAETRALEKQFRQGADEHEHLSREKLRLEGELEALRATSDQRERELLALEAQKATTDIELAALEENRDKVELLTVENTGLKSELEKKKDELRKAVLNERVRGTGVQQELRLQVEGLETEVTALKRERARMEAEIQVSSTEIQRSRQALQDQVERDVTREALHTNQMTDHVEKLSSENQSLAISLQAEKLAREAAVQRQEGAESESKIARAEHAALLEQLSETTQRLNREWQEDKQGLIERHNNEIAAMKKSHNSTLDAVNQRMSEISNQLINARAEGADMEMWKRRVDLMEGERKGLEMQIKSLQQQVHLVPTSNGSSGPAKSDPDASESATQGRCLALETQVDALQQQLQSREKLHARDSDSITRLRGDNTQLREELESERQLRKDLGAKKEQGVSAKQEEADKVLSEAVAKAHTLQTQLTEVVAQLSKTSSEHGANLSALQSREIEVKELRSRLANPSVLESKLEQLQKDKLTLEMQLEEVMNENLKGMHEARSNPALSSLENENAKLHGELKRLRTSLQEINSRDEEARARENVELKVLGELRLQNDKLEEENKDLKQKVELLGAAAKSYGSGYVVPGLEEQNTDLERQKLRLQYEVQQLQPVRAELDRLHAERAQLVLDGKDSSELAAKLEAVQIENKKLEGRLMERESQLAELEYLRPSMLPNSGGNTPGGPVGNFPEEPRPPPLPKPPQAVQDIETFAPTTAPHHMPPLGPSYRNVTPREASRPSSQPSPKPAPPPKAPSSAGGRAPTGARPSSPAVSYFKSMLKWTEAQGTPGSSESGDSLPSTADRGYRGKFRKGEGVSEAGDVPAAL